ncbi:MAG: hypothetical protein ACRC45_06010 [Cetobacterium sp.]
MFGYRKYFSKYQIPQHLHTMSKTFMRDYGIDDNPITAVLTGMSDT